MNWEAITAKFERVRTGDTDLQKKIRGLRRRLTLLLAEQSVPLALEIADYAYVLQTGRTVLEGKAVDLEKNEQVQEIYLGIAARAGAEGATRST